MTLSRHCVHSLTSFGVVNDVVHTEQYCCWCGEKREIKISGHEPDPGHGPNLDQIHMRAIWTDPWKDACPKRPEPTVSPETVNRRAMTVLEKYVPIMIESAEIAKKSRDHAENHEWGAVADCRSCQEEEAKA